MTTRSSQFLLLAALASALTPVWAGPIVKQDNQIRPATAPQVIPTGPSGPAMQPVGTVTPSGPAAAIMNSGPLVITGVKPEIPLATSDGQGKATVNFVVSGTGSGQCELRLYTGEGGQYSQQITPGSGFPKTFSVNFSKPSTFSIDVYGIGCEGSFRSMYTVQPHADFPCSKYPGFKKVTWGITMGCHPAAPSASPNPADFTCPQGTKFQSYAGYIFGCFPPGFFNQ